MPSRKMLKGVIRGFLGTYVSRYSEFDGRLLFGFVIEASTRMAFVSASLQRRFADSST